MKIKTLIAAALVMCFSLANVAKAQEEGFPFPPAAPAASPAPVNPTQSVMEGGKLLVVVGSERHFGYRIGEVIPVTVVISADPSVKINIDAIRRKSLSAEGSDFELVEAPVIVVENKNGRVNYVIQMKVRSWVIKDQKPVLTLAVDFLYATDMLPDGKTANWRPTSTPEFYVTTSNTVGDSAKELLEGDMSEKHAPEPVLVKPLKWAGFALISLLPLWLLVRLWKRLRPVKALSPAAKAWLVFDDVLEEARTTGVTYEHLQRVSNALRAYMGIEQVPLALVAVPLEQFYGLHSKKMELIAAAVSALTKLQIALYSDDKRQLTRPEIAELFSEIEKLVPRE